MWPRKMDVIRLRGRPKKENVRDIVYKVRLNEDEERMLNLASEWTSQAKSEVFRKALQDYFRSVELNQHLASREFEESGWVLDHISQQRIITCPYSDCGEEFAVDFAEFSEEQDSEGSMGQRCEHIFDTDDLECPACRRPIHASGVISEYPVGAYEYERIKVEEGADTDE